MELLVRNNRLREFSGVNLTVGLGAAVNFERFGEVRTGYGDDRLTQLGDVDNHFVTGDGEDIMRGGLAGDEMHGGTGNDTMLGQDGNDTLYGDDGDDMMRGHTGRDELYGGAGTASLYGDAGHDLLDGGAGNDLLEGGAGNDTLMGGPGSDTLYGGTGRDLLYGGGGADTFAFRTEAEANRDRIADFTGADVISLAEIDANTGQNGNQSFLFIGSERFSGTAGELRLIERGANTVVAADTDGDGNTDFSFKVLGYTGLTESDFLL